MSQQTIPGSGNGRSLESSVEGESSLTSEQQAGDELAAEQTRERLRRMPPEVGVVLVGVGIAGLILPGPVGTPLLVAGGLVLAPKMFGRVEKWMQRRFPSMHRHGMQHVDRYIDDLEKRYPPS